MKLSKTKQESRQLGNEFEDFQPSPGPVDGPDGMPVVPPSLLTTPPPIPEASTSTLLCLNGPCRHYLEIHSRADLETRALEREPRQVNRFCTVISGDPIELTDDCVFVCSAWDPLQPAELRDREKRRNVYRDAIRKKASDKKEGT